MYKINGHYIYLTDSQYNDIVDKVSKNETAMWRIQSRVIGWPENIELHNRIQQYIKNNFKQEYYKFDFYDEDAKNNIIGILSDYDKLSDIIEIVRADNIDFSDMLEETITGYNIKIIKIKIYEKTFFSWLFGKKDTGSSITINTKNIDHVYGELTNFIVESKAFNIQFTTDHVNLTYK